MVLGAPSARARLLVHPTAAVAQTVRRGAAGNPQFARRQLLWEHCVVQVVFVTERGCADSPQDSHRFSNRQTERTAFIRAEEDGTKRRQKREERRR
ncbi:unnamed protein product [Acanthoscelides obtectus]|uniref:Uncharacterized protein n=1 Tax=Acanthoscelides obtectus TaxID=200917 RepID=A0A9P0JLX1_ACAOB|nr:unnamed protein product [Acanthoscelides obtectus]CAK1654408.1 hypothetical protein AOBTE_LOCUS18565 [Acanthoscelides obtectus]